MATAEELLATVGNEEDYIVIDSDLRTMTFPASVKNIGVENDKDVHKLNFMMPRYFSEYDLSTFSIRINYLNAQGDGDMYVVTEPTVEEDAIYFSWLVGRHACLYRGAVTFIVCLKLADGEGDVAQEYNTTLASLQVLPGLETEPTILETDYDIIEQLLLTVQDTNDKIKAVLDSGMTAEELGNIAKEQKTLKSRMDEFASLPDGSTAGDAELTDIRVGADGATYKTAGEAVRTQIADLKAEIEPLGVSKNFTIDAFGTPTSYTIYGDFKSGDTIRVVCEFFKSGTGSYNCAVKNSANTNIKVFYGDGTDDITLSADTSILTFVLGKANTITALSADVTVLSKAFLQMDNDEAQVTTNKADIASLGGQLIENVTIASQLESGYWAFADGQSGSSANYARTIDFVPDDCVRISIPQSYAIYISLLAYNNGSYVGTYNHNTKTFDVTSSLTSAYGDFLYDLSAIRKAFPGYRYKLNFRAVTVSGPLDTVDVGEKTHFGMDAIKPRVFSVEKDGSGDFISLLSALRFATMFMDAVVYVGDGEWDLVSEFGSGLDAISSSNWGLYLKNRIRVIFSSNSKVTFHYTGSNTNVLKYFSPFNTGEYGFTLENLTLEASRCRYCVHDERGEETDHYECHYINCNMMMDNSQNEAWTTAQCIGGGLGRSAYIDIDGCVFDSNMWGGIVSYHNCAYANSKSNINLHDSYFKRNGTFRLSWYGVSTDITTAYISGCSFASEIVHRAENESATVENTAIIEWNNIVRS